MKITASRTKQLAFIAVMGALGNVLSMLSIFLANVGPVGLDLSHLATLIAAIYGGATMGLVVGALGGIFAGTYFGFIGGSLGLLGLIGLPLGKALTGLTAGWLSRSFKVVKLDRNPFFVVPTVLLSYIPESIFTAIYFLVLVPLFLGWSSIPLLVSIIVKAWGEFVLLSVICLALRKNKSFTGYMTRHLQP